MLVALRGSNALGIRSDDLDTVTVVKDNVVDILQDDNQVVSFETFAHWVSTGRLEVAEAFSSVLFSSEEMSSVIDKIVNDDDIRRLFNNALQAELFLAIKNQLKIISRYDDAYDKCMSKCYLFYELINNWDDVMSFWCVNSDLKDWYQDSKENGYSGTMSYEDFWDYRNDKETRKEMMLLKNEAHTLLVSHISKIVAT